MSEKLNYSVTLPTLLYTFALTEDVSLQNMLLELILRCFSQRSNLIKNLKQVNLFATNDEISIFTYFTRLIVKLRDCIQGSDNFLTISPNEDSSALIKEFRQLVANLTIGLLRGSRVNDNEKMIFDTSTQLTLSLDRQHMMNNLSIHQIVISFIQKKFPMVEKIVESDLAYEYKKEVLLLFQDCYTFLIFFCKANTNNQWMLYSNLEETLGNMKYEVGQIDLVCAVLSLYSRSTRATSRSSVISRTSKTLSCCSQGS